MTSLLRSAAAAAPIARSAAVPIARSAAASIARSAAARVAHRTPLVVTPSRHTFSTTAYLSNSTPPGKGPQQSPRKNEDQVKEARQASRSILYFSLATAGLVAGIFSYTRLSAEGQGPQAKRLSYAERVKASLAKSNDKGGVEAFHKAAEDIDGEDSPTSGEGTDAADLAAQQGPSSSSSSSTSASAGLETISQVVEDDTGEGQEAAYDPSTGQINWDCPCLGGMATGPCGEEFKEAFSCFVFSEAEPKGMECVGKFKGMQDCFRRHPEEYKEELEMEEEDESNSLIDEVEHALGLGGRGGESNQQVAA